MIEETWAGEGGGNIYIRPMHDPCRVKLRNAREHKNTCALGFLAVVLVALR